MNHTPAPWSVSTNHHADGQNRIDIKYPINQFGDLAIVAMVRTTKSDVAIADAKLIAAAPEMLEALQELIAVAKTFELLPKKWLDPLQAAENAVTKATV